MNLTGDPWIPVIYETGGHTLVSLNTLYADAERIKDLCATPPQRIALMRLLVCITQRALDGPEDEKDWSHCKSRVGPASLTYLKDHVREFGLDGDRPFLQISELTSSTCTVNDKLDFRLAAGNNAVLFDHAANQNGRPHDHAWYALMILTYQAFSTSGLVSGTVWAGIPVGRSSDHAPCVQGAAMHTLLRGENLLDTIHMNLLTRRCIQDHTSLEWGSPAWELPPKRPDDKTARRNANTFLGRLVPYSRAILLDKENSRMILGKGLSYPHLPEGREVTATVLLSTTDGTDTYSYLRVDISKHPWRELGSILTFTRRKNAGCALPLYHLGSGSTDTIDVWTGGMMPDPRKAGKILDVAEWTFSVPQTMLESSAIKRYQDGAELAEEAQRSLSNGITAYCLALKMDKKPKNALRSKAATYFWSTLDSSYPILLRAANSPEAGLADSWYPIVRNAMREAYTHACAHGTPRQIQAFAQGRQRLHLKKPE